MLSAEPRSDTVARRTRMQGDYPALQFSSPTEIAQVDASTPDQTPTNFTRDSLKYGLMALDTIDYPDFTRDKSWLTASQQPDETGPVGMQGPTGVPSGMAGPWGAPPSPLEQGGGAFDPGAYDAPFRPGGESDPYAPTSQPDVGRRLAGSFGVNTDTLGQDILDYPATIPGKLANTRLNPGGFDALANLSQDVNPGTALWRTLQDPLQIPKDIMGVKPLLAGSKEAELLSNPWNALPVGRAASVAGKIGENALGTIGAQALAEGSKAYGKYRGKPLSEAPEWIQQAVSLGVSVPGYVAGQKLAQGLGKAGESLAGVTAGRIPGMAGIENAFEAEQKAISARIAKDGLTPENVAARDDFLARMSEAFKNDVPSWEQPPPAVVNGSEGDRIGQAMLAGKRGEVVTDALANARNPNAAFVDDMAARINARNAAPSAAPDLLGPPLATESPEIQALAQRYTNLDATVERLRAQGRTRGISESARTLARVRGDLTRARKAALDAVEPGAAALPDAAASERVTARQAGADATALSRSGTADEQMAAQVGESIGGPQTEAQRARAAYDATKAAQTGDAWIDELPKGGTTLQGRILPGLSNSATTGALGGGVTGNLATPDDATPAERARNIALGAAGGAALGGGVGKLLERPGTIAHAGFDGQQASFAGMEPPKVPGSRLQNALKVVADIGNVPRTLQSSFDLSGSLRQAGFLLPAHPVAWKNAMGAQLKALVSEENAQAIQRGITESPMARYRPGLYQATWDGADIAGREEAFMSSLAGNLPGVKQTSRAYALMLNKYRADVFDSIAGKWPAEALSDSKRTATLERFVEAATGRGRLPDFLKDYAPVMNATFFSPRFLVSIPQRHAFAFSSDPLIRKEAIKDIGAFYGTGLTLLGAIGAAKQAGLAPGVSIETDPRSSDWGKVRVGPQRFDIWGSNQQFARMIAQFTMGIPPIRDAVGGNVKDVDSGTLSQTASIDVLQRFLRNKFSPTANIEEQIRTGKDFAGGKPPPAWETAIRLVTPLMLQDIYDSFQVGGAATAIPAALADFTGVGSSTYAERGSGSPGGSTARPSRPVRPSRPARPTR